MPKTTYILRVEITYDGDDEKPDEHVLRKWILNCMSEGSPPNASPRGHNRVTMGVRCAGRVESGNERRLLKKSSTG